MDTDETRKLMRLRDELSDAIAAVPPGDVNDAIAFEIAEIDLRLKELWSGENSGVKNVAVETLERIVDDRRGHVQRA
jgi:hypothetical protein